VFWRGIERSLEGGTDLDLHAPTSFGLAQTNVGAVVGRPREAQQVALSLPGPQRGQQREVQVHRRRAQEGGLVGGGPDLLGAVTAAIQPTTALAWVGADEATVQAPRQHASQNGPSVISLPPPCAGCDLIAPCHEDPARATVSQRGQRKVAKGLFDAPDQRDVAAPGAVGEQAEILAGLILLEQAQQSAARWYYLLGDGFVVARDEFRRAGFAAQCWSALPSPIVGLEAAVREALALAVESLQPNSHGASPSTYPNR
jgi:hypothetical protein